MRGGNSGGLNRKGRVVCSTVDGWSPDEGGVKTTQAQTSVSCTLCVYIKGKRSFGAAFSISDHPFLMFAFVPEPPCFTTQRPRFTRVPTVYVTPMLGNRMDFHVRNTRCTVHTVRDVSRLMQDNYFIFSRPKRYRPSKENMLIIEKLVFQ